MQKPKYVKPRTTNLRALPSAVGNSCVTGLPEYTMVSCNPNGSIALGTCNPGGIVYPRQVCETGSQAGFSCVSGFGAG